MIIPRGLDIQNIPTSKLAQDELIDRLISNLYETLIDKENENENENEMNENTFLNINNQKEKIYFNKLINKIFLKISNYEILNNNINILNNLNFYKYYQTNIEIFNNKNILFKELKYKINEINNINNENYINNCNFNDKMNKKLSEELIYTIEIRNSYNNNIIQIIKINNNNNLIELYDLLNCVHTDIPTQLSTDKMYELAGFLIINETIYLDCRYFNELTNQLIINNNNNNNEIPLAINNYITFQNNILNRNILINKRTNFNINQNLNENSIENSFENTNENENLNENNNNNNNNNNKNINEWNNLLNLALIKSKLMQRKKTKPKRTSTSTSTMNSIHLQTNNQTNIQTNNNNNNNFNNKFIIKNAKLIKIKDLLIKFNTNYNYYHFGCCLHYFRFTNIQKISNVISNDTNTNDVNACVCPYVCYQIVNTIKLCQICNVIEAKYVIYSDRLSDCNPYYSCQ